ncbi:MAG: MaoC family dehydratase [Porticoccaceae bacterium]|jgi:acyl dehydratase
MDTPFTPKTTFNKPASDRYFEDYIPGEVHEFGEIAVDEADIIAFARQYDPQYFHTDPAKARDSLFGGLIASGFHTGAMVMRLLVDHYLSAAAGMGSPGLDELRWPNPVRAGDRLWIRIATLDAKRSRSKPDRGVVSMLVEAFNQREEMVMTFKAAVFVGCRQ